MAITLETSARNAACDAIVDLLDSGAGTAVIEIRQSTTVLATIPLDATAAFGAAATGVATLSNLPREDTSADASGTADNFQAKDKDGNLIFSGTVTATSGGGDIELVSTSITVGQPVRITSGTFTMPATPA